MTGGIRHWPRIVTAKKKTNASQNHRGKPAMRRGSRFFFSTGRGSSVWQRQQTSLSSGFHVPQFGQSGIAVHLLYFSANPSVGTQISRGRKGFDVIHSGHRSRFVMILWAHGSTFGRERKCIAAVVHRAVIRRARTAPAGCSPAAAPVPTPRPAPHRSAVEGSRKSSTQCG